MFAFVCPIRHPETSNNYSDVIKHLQLTIESVCAQNTTKDFKFVIVCNEIPAIEVPNKHVDQVIFVSVDFKPPDNNKGTEVSLDAVKFDKGTKIARGLLFLKAHQPDYVFVIDGDDWINTNILATIKHTRADLLYANSGYVINFKNKTYTKKYGVCRYCGSTFIYKFNLLMNLSGLSNVTDKNASQQQLLQQIKPHILKNILGNHRHQIPFYRDLSLSIEEIPIPAVSWILNTGENHTGKDGGEYGQPLTPSLLKQFGLTSVTIKPLDVPLKYRAIAKLESFKSWLGWLFTNKNTEKI